jgi:uncharacterized DUF497 family protein
MDLNFDWDEDKAAINLKTHSVAFEDAAHVFCDPYRMEFFDDRESYGEDRFNTVGMVGNVALIVTYTMRDTAIRIISARKALSHEHRDYRKNRSLHP